MTVIKLNSCWLSQSDTSVECTGVVYTERQDEEQEITVVNDCYCMFNDIEADWKYTGRDENQH